MVTNNKPLKNYVMPGIAAVTMVLSGCSDGNYKVGNDHIQRVVADSNSRVGYVNQNQTTKQYIVYNSDSNAVINIGDTLKQEVKALGGSDIDSVYTTSKRIEKIVGENK